MFKPVELSVKAEHVLGPQATHQLDLFGLAATPRGEVLVEGVVFDRIPTHSHPEPQPVVGQQGDLGGLLGHQYRLALGQDQDRGDQLGCGGTTGQETEQHHRFVKRGVGVVWPLKPTGPIAVDAHHMVIDQ